MNLLSIQGHYAPAFRLNKADAAELKTQVENISQSHVLVISSKFRTDLLFYDTDDHAEEILKIWCNICGIEYKVSINNKFFRSKEELTTLTEFFYRLQLLYRMPAWYNTYYEVLLGIWMENSKDPILASLIKILMLLNDSKNEHALNLNKDKVNQVVVSFTSLHNLCSLNNHSVN